MLTRLTHLFVCGLTALALVATPGCGKQDPAKSPAEPKTEAKPEARPEVKPDSGDQAAAIPKEMLPEVEAKLALADKLDGKVDKIVHRCANCALGMDGKPEFSLEAAGYTLHFCTERCRDSFGKDLANAILKLEIPEK